ncbi:hypothetical protein B0T19DRAFT_428433 [Cercophora scortea]|uniref:Uncharacterized protein n=1 Tax=Cercophora scortea TaxID=314031 RepID=A0AAE0MAB0_9PEZI|nr:hypothetical protein B0T19DRAFT_428433 [Cercophora scortea]
MSVIGLEEPTEFLVSFALLWLFRTYFRVKESLERQPDLLWKYIWSLLAFGVAVWFLWPMVPAAMLAYDAVTTLAYGPGQTCCGADCPTLSQRHARRKVQRPSAAASDRGQPGQPHAVEEPRSRRDRELDSIEAEINSLYREVFGRRRWRFIHLV